MRKNAGVPTKIKGSKTESENFGTIQDTVLKVSLIKLYINKEENVPKVFMKDKIIIIIVYVFCIYKNIIVL